MQVNSQIDTVIMLYVQSQRGPMVRLFIRGVGSSRQNSGSGHSSAGSRSRWAVARDHWSSSTSIEVYVMQSR
eukprot:13528-Heterococcus_DN1.PRE.2